MDADQIILVLFLIFGAGLQARLIIGPELLSKRNLKLSGFLSLLVCIPFGLSLLEGKLAISEAVFVWLLVNGIALLFGYREKLMVKISELSVLQLLILCFFVLLDPGAYGLGGMSSLIIVGMIALGIPIVLYTLLNLNKNHRFVQVFLYIWYVAVHNFVFGLVIFVKVLDLVFEGGLQLDLNNIVFAVLLGMVFLQTVINYYYLVYLVPNKGDKNKSYQKRLSQSLDTTERVFLDTQLSYVQSVIVIVLMVSILALNLVFEFVSVEIMLLLVLALTERIVTK